MPVTYKKISSLTVTSATQASLEFTSIPQTYTDLVILFSARSSATDEDITVTFNTSGGTYAIRRMLGTGSATASDTTPTQGYLRVGSSTDTASTFSNGTLYIPDYTSNIQKSAWGDSVSENNGTRAIQMCAAGTWSETSAITSITLTKYASQNFVQHTSATLYGIKKA